MFYIKRNIELEKVTVKQLFKMFKNNEIDLTPYYQRYSDIWSLEKKRLLIDTLINGYDIPKFYFHYIISNSNELIKTNYKYAVIDGKQRINALIEFIEGKFSLNESVRYLENPDLKLNNLTYKKLMNRSDLWDIKERIDNFQLDIIHIITDEFDRIEEMFLRLNEGVPVNNAEKRNSIGGVLIEKVNKYTKEWDFFTKKVRFGNKRMEHQDLLLKLSLIESNNGKIESFTKKNLDNLVRSFKPKKNATKNEIENLNNKANELIENVYLNIKLFNKIFTDNDSLLRYKGIIPLYYLFIRKNNKINPKAFRHFLEKFEEVRINNRKIGKQKPNTTLLQFDRLNQQGAHQAKSLEIRLKILEFYFSNGINSFDKEMPKKEIGIIENDEIV